MNKMVFPAVVIMYIVAIVWIWSQDTGEAPNDIKSGRYSAGGTVYRFITVHELKRRGAEIRPGVWRGVYDGFEFEYHER